VLPLLRRWENLPLAVAVSITIVADSGRDDSPSWVIATLFVGLIVGAIAKFTMPGRDTRGIIVLSVAGAFVGCFLGLISGLADNPNTGIADFILISISALALPFIYRLVARSGATR
jgi:uncharacterized membrane protein YeaQ/YmgE (transglycosylase-associated protein family)